jgi:hypothetical protein
MSVNKKDFMEFVSKAYDQGFRIEMSSYSNRFSKEEAEKIGLEFAGIIGKGLEEKKQSGSKWFRTESENFGCSVFHKDSEERNKDGYWLLFKDDEYVEDDLYPQDEENAG